MHNLYILAESTSRRHWRIQTNITAERLLLRIKASMMVDEFPLSLGHKFAKDRGLAQCLTHVFFKCHPLSWQFFSWNQTWRLSQWAFHQWCRSYICWRSKYRLLDCLQLCRCFSAVFQRHQLADHSWEYKNDRPPHMCRSHSKRLSSAKGTYIIEILTRLSAKAVWKQLHSGKWRGRISICWNELGRFPIECTLLRLQRTYIVNKSWWDLSYFELHSHFLSLVKLYKMIQWKYLKKKAMRRRSIEWPFKS